MGKARADPGDRKGYQGFNGVNPDGKNGKKGKMRASLEGNNGKFIKYANRRYRECRKY